MSANEEEPVADKIWRLCNELNVAIEAAVRAGYRVDIRHDEYGEFGLKENFTIVQANVYKGITLKDKVMPR